MGTFFILAEYRRVGLSDSPEEHDVKFSCRVA